MPQREKLSLPWNVEKEVELVYPFNPEKDHGVTEFSDSQTGETKKSEWWKFAVKENDEVKTLFINDQKAANYIINNIDQGQRFKIERYKRGDEAFKWRFDGKFLDETEKGGPKEKQKRNRLDSFLINRSIEAQCALKAAVELAVNDKIELFEIIDWAEKFSSRMPCHQVESQPSDDLSKELDRLGISRSDVEQVVKARTGGEISDLNEKAYSALISRLRKFDSAQEFNRWKEEVLKEPVLDAIEKWRKEEGIEKSQVKIIAEYEGFDSLREMSLEDLEEVEHTITGMRKDDFEKYIDDLTQGKVEEIEDEIPF